MTRLAGRRLDGRRPRTDAGVLSSRHYIGPPYPQLHDLEDRTPIYLLYNSLLILLSPLLGVGLLARLAKGKSRQGWAERWGRLPDSLRKRPGTRIWVHAASVGEVMAATPILKEYRERRPDDDIVVSVVTPGGHEVATTLVGKLVSGVFYAPFDVPPAVNRAVAVVQPDVFVNLETELWPNLLSRLRGVGARLILVNGRISDRSFGSYRRLRGLFHWVLGQFDRILAQTEDDASRFRSIGADPSRVACAGNAKFDQLTRRLSADEVAALRRDLRLPDGAPVWVVGSTRMQEEEQHVIAAYLKAREEVPDLVLIHAPRHVERAGEVEAAMRSAGLTPLRRTQTAGHEGTVEQLILDTFGELSDVYAVCNVAFIGNSLTAPGGGQNLLQPLAHGKPALYGPYMNNFRDIVSMAEAAGVGFCVDGPDALARKVVECIQDRDGRTDMAQRAMHLVDGNRGAAARYAEAIAGLAAQP
jgi:3-deoxy-D-manno-octulosonic-acid transferase